MSRGDAPDSKTVSASARSLRYQQMLEEFAELYKISKPIEREYAVLLKGQAFEAQHGFSCKDYQRLFLLYVDDRRTPDFVERVATQTSRLEPVVRIFQSLASLAIIVSAVQLVTGFQEQRVQLVAERWETLSSDLNAGDAKREAIEYLHDRGGRLSGIELLDVQLSRLNLPERVLPKAQRQYLPKVERNLAQGASLQEAKFRGSNLYQAYFRGANLYLSDFSSLAESKTNANGANFRDADLRQTNFTGADLRNACFRGANLEKADFTGAFLDNADFREARYLEPSQLEVANGARNALYDASLNRTLSSGGLSEKAEPASCRRQPRKIGWLRAWLVF